MTDTDSCPKQDTNLRVPTISIIKESNPNRPEPIYESIDIDEGLDDILDEIEDPSNTINPAQREAIVEFVDIKKKKKYLFDGLNLIRITPMKSTKVKAVIGKAFWLHKKFNRRMSTMKMAVVEKVVGTFSGSLSDYVPDSGPKIPPLIYHSVKEIERREPITRTWIYRTPSSSNVISKVKRTFLRGKVPDLSSYDVHVPAGIILSFLGDLKEPLIPTSSWKDFIGVSLISSKDLQMKQLKRIITGLPLANRATLKFLVRHLQEMAKCRYSKLSLGTAAAVFAPLTIGFSDPNQESEERDMIAEIMFAMLKMEPQFFETEF